MNYKRLSQFIIYGVPFLIFGSLILLFWRGLSVDPHRLPSALIGKPVPVFELLDLNNPPQRFTHKDLQGHVSLLNIWASWCGACQIEHPLLMALAQSKRVLIYGLDYRDNYGAAQQWLQQQGNPYHAVGFDHNGSTGIDWGVYGVPETFIIDKQGIIRYRHAGALTREQWQQVIMPLIDHLKSEP